MNKKRWALTLFGILLVAGYIKLFYKTYSEKVVVENADGIATLDVKRITNTVIWQYITTPSLWKMGSLFSASDKVSWDDMVKIPDYVFIFHIKEQPAKAWYTVLQIKDRTDFEKGLVQFQFQNRPGTKEYFSTQYGIEYIQNGEQLLVGNLAVEDKQYIRQAADLLFIQQKYINKETLQKNIDAASHFSFQLNQASGIKEMMVTGNFDKHSLSLEAAISPSAPFTFSSNIFKYVSGDVCALGFTQPPANLYKSIPDSVKLKASRLLNFDIDSLMEPGNHYYQLDVKGIKTRLDSAISYEYDNDFNQVEKVVVNNVDEPSFKMNVSGFNVSGIYSYWKNNQKLEETPEGALFTPMPLVKSYAELESPTDLSITSNNYKRELRDATFNGILYLHLSLSKIPASVLKYLPDNIVHTTSNIESADLSVKNGRGKIQMNLQLIKKENDSPIISW